MIDAKTVEVRLQAHIYLEPVSSGERHKHIYVVIPISVFKKAKNGTSARKNNEETHKLMYI